MEIRGSLWLERNGGEVVAATPSFIVTALSFFLDFDQPRFTLP
jgi:hypothetical protein